MAHHRECLQHAHSYAPADFTLAFALGTGLNLAFVVTELAFGFVANSLALIADAIHNFSDVIGLVLAWGAAALAKRGPTASRTYGFRRGSILAAIGNAALLFVAIGAIAVEAMHRLQEPAPVASNTVLWVAGIGILINGLTALLFMRGREQDLNIRGAFLHMAADALVSAGVVLAALLIGFTGWLWLDPAVSLAVAVVILAGSVGLARESFNLALDAVPRGIDRVGIESYLAGLPGVIEVHDLHIWAMSTTETALTAHLVRPRSVADDHLLMAAADELRHRFGIQHATLQVEAGDPAHPCPLASADVV